MGHGRGARLRGALGAVAALAVVAVSCTVQVSTDPPPGVTGPSPGCGTTERGAVTERTERIGAAGRYRRYMLTVPPRHTPGTDDPLPLVLDFHGLLEGWAGTHPFATQFSALAESEGFVVAFPIGSANGVFWDVSLREGNPDLQFVDRLVESLGDELCIDRSRVYVTGLSYGAFMTSMLMCMRPNTFAAAAPVAGMADLCTAGDPETSPGWKVPFVTFHGTADNILPYPLFEDAPRSVAAKYGCVGPPGETVLEPNPDPGSWGPSKHYVWDCTQAGTAAESYVLHGGGHSWPGSEFFTWIGPIVGRTSTLDATAAIWEFFSRHQR